MYKQLICLFAIVAVAFASNQDEISQLVKDAVPMLEVDVNCIKNSGIISQAPCLISNVEDCTKKEGLDYVKVARCLAKRCKVDIAKLLNCIKA